MSNISEKEHDSETPGTARANEIDRKMKNLFWISLVLLVFGWPIFAIFVMHNLLLVLPFYPGTPFLSTMSGIYSLIGFSFGIFGLFGVLIKLSGKKPFYIVRGIGVIWFLFISVLVILAFFSIDSD